MKAIITNIQTEQKPQDWRVALVASWKKFREGIGLPCDLGYGVLMNRIYSMTKQVDQMTGEIFMEEISLDMWQRQLDGFKRNEYAKKAEYPFSLFQKQFGTFNAKPQKVIETKRETKQLKDVLIWCDKHGNVPSNHLCES